MQLKLVGYQPHSFLFAYGEWPPQTHELLRDKIVEIIAGLSSAFSMSGAGHGA